MPNIAILFETCDKTPMVLRPDHIDMIRAHNPDGEVRYFPNEAALNEADFDAEILISWGRFTPNTFCNRCTNLRWIHSISAGVEGLMQLDVAKPPLVISKMAGIHGIPMSEHTMCFILSFLRRFPLMYARQQQHLWKKPDGPRPDECQDKTVSIIGIGAIGQEVARKCKLFGMRVIGCKRRPTPMEFVDEMYPVTELDKVLNQSDFVVCLVPHAPESEHMFSDAQFAQMKPNAVFINIGRGAVVNTDAMIRALKNGTIAGAALDAFEEEPLPKESPLWDMENVIVSPHCASDSPYYFDRGVPLICNSLDKYLKGEEIPDRVL